MKRSLVALCLYIISGFPALAHPHMSLDCYLDFEFSGESCVGFWAEWTMDVYFSTLIIQENDKDHNGLFDKQEALRVYDKAFQNLKKFGYFTYIRSGNTRFTPEAINNFTPTIRDGRLIYRFYVTLENRKLGKDFSVAIFDSTYYCAVFYKTPAAVLHQLQSKTKTPNWSRVKNEKFPVYYNPTGAATDGAVYTKWKPGLETAYPEEIRVFW